MSSTHERNDQVNVVVTEDQKQRWQEHLEQHEAEFQSLSHLIRQSVEKEVNGSAESEPTSPAPSRDNSEVLEAIGRLDEMLQEPESRVTSIENRFNTIQMCVTSPTTSLSTSRRNRHC